MFYYVQGTFMSLGITPFSQLPTVLGVLEKRSSNFLQPSKKSDEIKPNIVIRFANYIVSFLASLFSTKNAQEPIKYDSQTTAMLYSIASVWPTECPSVAEQHTLLTAHTPDGVDRLVLENKPNGLVLVANSVATNPNRIDYYPNSHDEVLKRLDILPHQYPGATLRFYINVMHIVEEKQKKSEMFDRIKALVANPITLEAKELIKILQEAKEKKILSPEEIKQIMSAKFVATKPKHLASLLIRILDANLLSDDDIKQIVGERNIDEILQSLSETLQPLLSDPNNLLETVKKMLDILGFSNTEQLKTFLQTPSVESLDYNVMELICKLDALVTKDNKRLQHSAKKQILGLFIGIYIKECLKSVTNPLTDRSGKVINIFLEVLSKLEMANMLEDSDKLSRALGVLPAIMDDETVASSSYESNSYGSGSYKSNSYGSGSYKSNKPLSNLPFAMD